MRRWSVLLLAVLAAGVGSLAQGERKLVCSPVGPKSFLHGEVLVRPKPLCHLPGANIPVAISILADVVRRQGFSTVQPIPAEGEIRAQRDVKNGQDRVVIWIERDLFEPTKQFRVYVDTALYQEFFGEQELRPVRATVPAANRFHALRAALSQAASHKRDEATK